jgi:hypothetical protein
MINHRPSTLRGGGEVRRITGLASCAMPHHVLYARGRALFNESATPPLADLLQGAAATTRWSVAVSVDLACLAETDVSAVAVALTSSSRQQKSTATGECGAKGSALTAVVLISNSAASVRNAYIRR